MNQETKWLMDYLDQHDILPEMQTACDLALHWAYTTYSYESKNKRIQEWRQQMVPCDSPFYEVMCQIFIATLMEPQGMLYQALIGYIANEVLCEDPLDRAKCAAELIALAYQAELITVTRTSDKTLMVSTDFVLPVEIPQFMRHLPSFKKPTADYTPILGCRLKKHDMDICLDHIQRMNSIALCLDERIIHSMEEYKKHEPETVEQEEQWQIFKRQSAEVYRTVLDNGNRFYLRHNYDTRGRCYCEGYYINYQGSSYKKAIVQLADKEIVKL